MTTSPPPTKHGFPCATSRTVVRKHPLSRRKSTNRRRDVVASWHLAADSFVLISDCRSAPCVRLTARNAYDTGCGRPSCGGAFRGASKQLFGVKSQDPHGKKSLDRRLPDYNWSGA